jgi:hypothetical protein
MFNKENCLTVRDLIQALSSSGVNPDMPVGHTLSGLGWISKVSAISLVDGAVVLETDTHEGTLNEEEHASNWKDVHDLLA